MRVERAFWFATAIVVIAAILVCQHTKTTWFVGFLALITVWIQLLVVLVSPKSKGAGSAALELLEKLLKRFIRPHDDKN
jgi:Trk-type K+ transport system membrane component